MKDYTRILQDIAKQYKLSPILYDETTDYFVSSICNQYINKGLLSARQIAALVKITSNIKEYGAKPLPKAVPEPQGKGYLGINCKTGEAYWHSWKILKEDYESL